MQLNLQHSLSPGKNHVNISVFNIGLLRFFRVCTYDVFKSSVKFKRIISSSFFPLYVVFFCSFALSLPVYAFMYRFKYVVCVFFFILFISVTDLFFASFYFVFFCLTFLCERAQRIQTCRRPTTRVYIRCTCSNCHHIP